MQISEVERIVTGQHKLRSIDGVCGIMLNNAELLDEARIRIISVGIDNVPHELWIETRLCVLSKDM